MTNKLKAIWYILTGETVAYNLTIEGGIVLNDGDKAFVYGCEIRNGNVGVRTDG